MRAAIAAIFFVVVLLLPPAAIAGSILWARRLARRPGVPRFAAWAAYALAGVAMLVMVGGMVSGFVVGTGDLGSDAEPSDKARRLAEGISEAMNCTALGLLVAGAAAAWILVWWWRTRPPDSD
jgi:hypothetical protein